MTIQEYNDLYKNPIVKKMMITSSGGIAITNPNIVSEQMTVEDALCSGTNLTYGACESACFKIRIADLNHNFEGEWLDVYQKLVTDEDGYLMLEDGGYLLQESGYRIQLESQGEATAHIGKFKVLSDKPTSDRRWRDLTCYDMMRDIINMDVFEWYASLTFPMTIKQLRDSFFAYIQVPQQTTTLINDSFVVIGDFAVGGTLSGKDVITSICELNGVFGHISRDGVFEYISLPSAETITLDWYVNGSGTYEDYVCDKITGITAKSNADGDIGTTVGTEDNLYQISGNLMIVGQEGTDELSAALTTLLNAIKDNQYRPFTVKTYGNPMLAVGTSIVINTRDKVINSFVMAKTMTGIQSLKDDLSAKGNKTYPIDANSLQRQINNVSGAVNGVKSEIKKTNNEIVLKVDDNGNIVKVALGTDAEHGTTFTVGADNISLSASEVINLMSDGDINLTANDITISATNFSVDENGNLTCTNADISGKVTANDGEIGGFTIDGTSIRTDLLTSSADGSIGLSTTNFTRAINGTNRSLRFAMGSKFGVDSNGKIYCDGLYASDVNIASGSIKLETSGQDDSRIRVYYTSQYNGLMETSVYGGAIILKQQYSPEQTEIYAGTINTTGDVNCVSATASANMYASSFVQVSSRLVKENIKETTKDKARKILDLDVVDFDYISGQKGQTGLIAEDVIDIFPNVVNVPNDYNEDETKERLANGELAPVMGIDYTKFVPYLIKMVQMQQKEIDELKGA
jgi:hypothetical protein